MQTEEHQYRVGKLGLGDLGIWNEILGSFPNIQGEKNVQNRLPVSRMHDGTKISVR